MRSLPLYGLSRSRDKIATVFKYRNGIYIYNPTTTTAWSHWQYFRTVLLKVDTYDLTCQIFGNKIWNIHIKIHCVIFLYLSEWQWFFGLHFYNIQFEVEVERISTRSQSGKCLLFVISYVLAIKGCAYIVYACNVLSLKYYWLIYKLL